MLTWLKRYKLQFAAAALILAGLGIMIPRGLGMLDFYREAQYATANHFGDGNPSTDLLRPWMTVRYVAAAYGVPQAYIFEKLNIQPKRETSMLSLSRLNQTLRLGNANGQPALLAQIRAVIEHYRAAPVVTGLMERGVQDWMTIQYLSNSTGITPEVFFQELGYPMEGHVYLPIGFLSDQLKYPGGGPALSQKLLQIVDAHNAGGQP